MGGGKTCPFFPDKKIHTTTDAASRALRRSFKSVVGAGREWDWSCGVFSCSDHWHLGRKVRGYERVVSDLPLVEGKDGVAVERDDAV